MSFSQAVLATPLSLYVRYIPFNPPNLFLQTDRAPTAFFVPIPAGDTFSYTLTPVLADIQVFAAGNLPVSFVTFAGGAGCPGPRTVTISVDFVISGITTPIATETQNIVSAVVPTTVEIFNFNALNLATNTTLQAGDSIVMRVTNAGAGVLCMVNEFPIGGVDTDATRIVFDNIPILDVDKTITSIVDPVSGTAKPLTSASPGDIISYLINITNNGGEDATGIILNDNLSEFSAIGINTHGPGVVFQLIEGAPPSTLTLGTPVYSENNGVDFTYTPLTSEAGGASAGFDALVTDWQIPMLGNMPLGSSFSLEYSVEVR